MSKEAMPQEVYDENIEVIHELKVHLDELVDEMNEYIEQLEEERSYRESVGIAAGLRMIRMDLGRAATTTDALLKMASTFFDRESVEK